MSTPFSNFRLSDDERSDAMSALSSALSEGRISVDEFDRRCKKVAEAQFQQDLKPLFSDIPQSPIPQSGALATTGEGDVERYSANELAAARRSGKRTRAGIFWIGSFLALPALAFTVGLTGQAAFTLLFLVVPPILFVLLYVLKVGPDSWYTPSVRELERKRRELVRIQQLELEQERAQEEAERRLARKQQVYEITDDALRAAQRTVKRFRGTD